MKIRQRNEQFHDDADDDVDVDNEDDDVDEDDDGTMSTAQRHTQLMQLRLQSNLRKVCVWAHHPSGPSGAHQFYLTL